MAKHTYIYGLIHPDNPLEQRWVRYVGKANDPKRRLKQHSFISKNLHNKFYRWINEIIKTNRQPKVLVLEKCLFETWEDRERFWIKKLHDENGLFNLHPGGGGLCSLSKEIRENISRANSGKNGYWYGKKFSIEHRKKLSLASINKNLGKKISSERRKKLSELFSGKNNPMFGKKHSKKTLKKISEAKKGKTTGKNGFWYGKKFSLETRKKMSESRKGKFAPMYGKKHSLKTRKKMSLAHKGCIPWNKGHKSKTN